MRKLFTSIALFTLLFILVSPAFGGETMKVYVIQSEPLGFQDPSGNPAGIHYDIVKAISGRSGIPMDIRIVPKERIFHEIKSGKVDGGVFFAFKKWDAHTISGGVVSDVKVIAVNRKDMPLNAYEDLYKSSRIGMMPKMNITPQFDSDAKLKKSEIENYEIMMKLLANKRIDTATGNMAVLKYLAKKYGFLDRIGFPGLLLKTIPNQLHISKKSPHLDKAGQLKKAAKDLENEGAFVKILAKYTE